MTEPRIKQGRAVWAYLRAHPGASVSEVARATGCKWETAKAHVTVYLSETTTSGVNPAAADAAKTANTVSKVETPNPVPPPQSGDADLHEDYPMPKKKTPAKPDTPDPKPSPKPSEEEWTW